MKTKRLVSLLAAIGLLATGVIAQTTTPPPGVPALATSINVSLGVSSTGAGSSQRLSQNGNNDTQTESKIDNNRHNTRDFLAYLNTKYSLVPDINGWRLVGVLPDATDVSADYRLYLVKDGETPVLIGSDKLALTVDAAAYAYRERSRSGNLMSGGGKFTYAVTLTAGEFTLHGIANGGYTVRSVTVNGTTATLAIPSAIVFQLAGVKDDGTTRSVVQGSMVFTAHKPVDLNDYPAPPPPPAPTP